MTTPVDLVRQLEDTLGRTSPIDAGLSEVLAEAERETSPVQRFRIVQRLLRERIRALEEAAVALGNLSKAVARLRRVFRFTEDGWPEERARLQDLAASSPADAAEAWLDFTWQAAADYRLEAIRRLVEEGPLPDGYGALRDRIRTCAAGLSGKDLWLSLPVLAEGLFDTSALDPRRGGVMLHLRLLLARLALLARDVDVSEQMLSQASGAAVLALRAACAREGDDLDGARRLLSEAEAIDAFDMDVVHEGIRQALVLRMPQEARDIAQRAVDVRTSLIDIEHELGKLLEPPAQLWLAVAQRAHRESSARLCTAALEEATEAAWAEDEYDRVLAEVNEIRAAMSEGIDRARHLMDAGDRWLPVPDIATAREDYETALSAFDHSRAPRLWASLVFRRADCIAAQASQEALREVRSELTAALEDLTDAQRVPGAAIEEPWNFGVEFDLRGRLASCLDQRRNDHYWRGFLAALRSVSLEPDESRSWLSAAEAAGSLNLAALALAAAEASFRRSDMQDSSALVVALTNACRYEEALGRLEEDHSPWADSVRGWIRWRQGEVQESTRLLSSVVIDPLWRWARDALLSSLVLSGRRELARSSAESFAAELPEQLEEFQLALHAARVSLLLGDVDEALRRASEAQDAEVGSDEGEASYTLAQILLLSGDRARANAVMERALAGRKSPSLSEWFVIDRRHLCAVADMNDLPLEGVDDFDALIRARQAEREEEPPETLHGSLKRLDDSGVDTKVVECTRRLAVAVAAVATGDVAAARQGISALPASLNDERDSLEVHIDRLARAEGAVTEEPARTPRDGADEVSVDGSTSVAPEDQPSESGQPLSAIRLALPASWFDNYDNPVLQHAIFLRCLPELRERSTVEIPPVRVSAEPHLEPDRYEVLAADTGTLLVAGRLPGGSRFCDDEALAVLPDHLRTVAETMPGDLAAVPEAHFTPQDHVARLLTMDRNEAAVAEVGRAVMLRASAGAGTPRVRSTQDVQAGERAASASPGHAK